MDDLIPWLRAQLDEDERDAPEVHAASCPAVDSSGALYAVTSDACTCGWPNRLLAEVGAKRGILADYERYASERRRAMNGWDPEARNPSPVVRFLALPYAGREGYREEWRP